MKTSRFTADLHVHSKYSRATARNLDLENLYIWAQCKGITVVGTGDFTHPAWFAEIAEKLEPAEPGLYRLRSDIENTCDEKVPKSCRAPVRFLLSCEISNIYKKRDKTRKNHNLVFFPELDDVRKFNRRLEKIGNIHSDGRPILGLDARDLLEITLETSLSGFLVPAHIWTPWFSLLGSKSGFDSVAECFGDLSPHIFAAETGLSSDPAMNWRVPDLDSITLISNSDAHSPDKLGREANLFNTVLSYHAIRAAIETGDKERFLGTIEFYPEEGKYHGDGHRNCGICFTPEETRAHNGMCPVCEKPLTVGVLYRVEELAGRADGFQPERAFPFYRRIPLETLLSHILRVGPKSKKVSGHYWKLLEALGSELSILHTVDPDQIGQAGGALLAEAIRRMREDRVSFSPGYDGCFGTVCIFSDAERAAHTGQHRLFEGFGEEIEKAQKTSSRPPETPSLLFSPPRAPKPENAAGTLPGFSSVRLNPDQQRAVDHEGGHLMIIAGPGTGKTRTLTHRIGRIIRSGTDVRQILAVTFTHKAAGEMRERLRHLLGDDHPLPFVGTFHALGYQMLRDFQAKDPEKVPWQVIDEDRRKQVVRDAMALVGLEKTVRADVLMRWMALAKQGRRTFRDDLSGICPEDQIPVFQRVYEAYEGLMNRFRFLDFEDLVLRAVSLLGPETAPKNAWLSRFAYIFVDEYQDINAGQYEMIRRLAGDHARVCLIGDPDQSIYGFRGSDARCFTWFSTDFPHAATVFLKENYRSTRTILEISAQVIRNNPEISETGPRQAAFSTLTGDPVISIMEMDTERAEAVAIGKTIEKMVGGTGFFAIDAGKVDRTTDGAAFGFSDFAVLFRTRQQADVIKTVLEKAGIPCQVADRTRVLDHPGIRSLLAMFRLVQEMADFFDVETAVPLLDRKISAKTVNALKMWAYENQWSLSDALRRMERMTISGLRKEKQQQLAAALCQLNLLRDRSRPLSLADTLSFLASACGLGPAFSGDAIFERGLEILTEIAAADPAATPADFLSAAAQYKDTDLYDHRAQKVSLLTLHAAKGLEFPVVFVAGCEDGLVPLSAEGRPPDVEEERRLFYVALTRAKHHLFLTRAKTRRINGKVCPQALSPFVREIEDRYMRFSGQKKKPSPQTSRQLSLF